MALYYLQGSPEENREYRSVTCLQHVILWFGIASMIGLSLLQGFGVFWNGEREVIHLIPKEWRPEVPKVILLQLDKEEAGFKPLDVAMALRCLEKLHPAEVVFSGMIASDPETTPLLDDLFARTSQEKIKLVRPILPSQEAQYRPVRLVCYDPPNSLGLTSRFETLPGSVSNKGDGFFLPEPLSHQGAKLPFFAQTKYGEVIPSLWWGSLMDGKTPSSDILWLFGGRILLLPNHGTLFMDGAGSAIPVPREGGRIIPFDDFLLQMEQKERGNLSPGFDALWNQSLIVIGTNEDTEQVALFSALAEKISWAHLPPLWQCTEVAMLVVLVLLLHQRRLSLRIVVAMMILLGTIATTILCARHSLLVPFLPSLAAGFLLLLPARPGVSD
jgi:hypothetical protein